MKRRWSHQKYTYCPWHGTARHSWETVTDVGAVHFHVSFYNADAEPGCGLEFHHGDALAAKHWPGEAPHHMDCPLTGGRCWHDGTSLYAQETIWPSVKSSLSVGDHDAVFRLLELECNRRFDKLISEYTGEQE